MRIPRLVAKPWLVRHHPNHPGFVFIGPSCISRHRSTCPKPTSKSPLSYPPSSSSNPSSLFSNSPVNNSESESRTSVPPAGAKHNGHSPLESNKEQHQMGNSQRDGGDVKNGLAIEIWDRLEICKSCDNGKVYVNDYPTLCAACGCLIQAKAMFPALHCPIHKW